jgi:hypothetical protein
MHEHFPQHTCPRCQRKAGAPYRVVPVDTVTLRLLVRCDACRHRWSVIVPKNSVPDVTLARLAGRTVWPAFN